MRIYATINKSTNKVTVWELKPERYEEKDKDGKMIRKGWEGFKAHWATDELKQAIRDAVQNDLKYSVDPCYAIELE